MCFVSTLKNVVDGMLSISRNKEMYLFVQKFIFAYYFLAIAKSWINNINNIQYCSLVN